MENNEKDVQPTEQVKPAKAKMSRKKKIIITLCIVLGILLTLVAAAAIAVNAYLDHMLDYISYDNLEEEWSGVDIDASDYGQGEDIDYGSDFVDPEADPDYSVDTSDDESGNENSESSEGSGDETSEAPGESSGSESSTGSGSGGSSGKPITSEKPYQPDNDIISGLFDNSDINYEYDSDVINILLIGADIRSTTGQGTGRSDTMIIMSINTVKKQITFTSLMRDLYVEIPGYLENRLNAAHSAGGPKLLMQTIEKNFGIPIDYYVRVNFSSFKGAVDAIGGIDLTVNSVNYAYFKDFSELKGLTKAQAIDGTHTIHLNGTKALAYARSRNYASADFARTQNQRDLLRQLVTNLKGSSLSELHELLKTVLPYVVTNMPKDMLKMMVYESVEYVSYDIQSLRVPDSGSYFKLVRRRGMSVIDFDKAANKKYLWDKIYGES